jgi:hypothetical protein
MSKQLMPFHPTLDATLSHWRSLIENAELVDRAVVFNRADYGDLREPNRIPTLCRDYRETITKIRLNAKSLKDAGWEK